MGTRIVSAGKRRQGAQAKAFGDLFEKIFLLHCRHAQIAITRVPDSCRQISHTRFIRVESPFDWIISYKGKTAVLDTKTSAGNTFAYSSIKNHQVREMRMHESAGIYGGYVIWLRGENKVLFMTASILEYLIDSRGSIDSTHAHVLHLGTSENFNLKLLFELPNRETR